MLRLVGCGDKKIFERDFVLRGLSENTGSSCFVAFQKGSNLCKGKKTKNSRQYV